MKESQRIAALFSALYHGEPWIDVTLLDTLQRIPYQKAAEHYENCNSIWETVHHIIAWRENVLRRIQGEVITTPEHNYFEKVTDTSKDAWETTLQNLAQSQQKWLAYLENCDENEFNKVYPDNGLNYYEHIHGILQHDAYHLGQLSLLAKLT